MNNPPLKDQPPVKPSEQIREKIANLEQYYQQLKERGAPPSELLAQTEKIAQAYRELMLVSD